MTGGSVGRSRFERLVMFPLLAFYCAVLVMAAWPRQLMTGGAMALAQTGANWVLAELGWPAGEAVFTGQGDRQVASLRACFRLMGVTRAGEGTVLFDTMADCAEQRRTALKDPLGVYLTRTLARGLRYLHTPGVNADRNSYPVSELFAIADYYCHKDGLPLERVVITARYQQRRLSDGALIEWAVDEGAHHCEEGAWEPLGLKHPVN